MSLEQTALNPRISPESESVSRLLAADRSIASVTIGKFPNLRLFNKP